jgi:hypothetical protein
LLGQVLHPDHFVDRGPDDRKLQPLRHADIAVDHLAQMQRDAEVEHRVVCLRQRGVKPPAGLEGRGERAATGFFGRPLDPEQAQHGVADQ